MSFLAKDPPDFEAAKRIYTEVCFRQKSPKITICNIQGGNSCNIQGGNSCNGKVKITMCNIQGGHSGKTTEIKLSEKLWLDYPVGTVVSQVSPKTV